MADECKRRVFAVEIAVLAVIYFLSARWGLAIGPVNTFATLIWAPTGISLAAMLLRGPQLWPGVALGALAANWAAGADVHVAMAIAIGNTLEALTGYHLLARTSFQRSLERIKDVFLFMALAAFGSTLVSATLGVSTLFLFGKIPWESIGNTWLVWWMGDALGNILVAPFILVWSCHQWRGKFSAMRSAEIVLHLLVVASIGIVVCSSQPGALLHPYLIFPLLMITAVRLDQKWTVTAIFTVAAIVIALTIQETGIFWRGSLSHSLLQAQLFLGMLAVSKMALAAAVMERRSREVEAREAVLARDEFLSIASHELKTPLTSLSLRLQLTSHQLKKLDDSSGFYQLSKEGAAMIQGCENQLLKLTALLEELLDLTRIRSGRMQLDISNFDLCTLVREVVDRFRVQQSAHAGSITIHGADSAFGNWDRVRLEQVVSNLISNALKYGNGKPVKVNVKSNGQSVALSVEDQGIGISKEMTTKIFERFERAGIGKNIAGLGLGLYIARQIVEAHGGTITAESDVGRGSLFTVVLPGTSANATV